jgi:hypothetical protein
MTSSLAAVVGDDLQVWTGICEGSKYIVVAEERSVIPGRFLSEGLTIHQRADFRCQASIYVSFDSNCKRIIRDIFREIICQKDERDGTEAIFYTFFYGNGNENYQLGAIFSDTRPGFKKV